MHGECKNVIILYKNYIMRKTKKMFRKRTKHNKQNKTQFGGENTPSPIYYDAVESPYNSSSPPYVDARESQDNSSSPLYVDARESPPPHLNNSHKRIRKSIKSKKNKKLSPLPETPEALLKTLRDERMIETVEVGEYDLEVIPPFWKDYIIRNNPSLETADKVREYIKQIINNIESCNNITFTSPNEPYHNVICNSFLFIAYVTLLLNDECTIIIKGGKAIQLAIKKSGCSAGRLSRYISPDVDVVIVNKPESKYTTRKLAKEIGKLFLWVMNSEKIPTISLLEVDYPEPIIKISLIKPGEGFYAIIDIAYNELDKNIKSYFQEQSLQEEIFEDNSGKIYYPTLLSLIHERLYYLIKYFNGDYAGLAEQEKNSIERFIIKIWKSINALLNCTITDAKRTNKGKRILLNTLLFNIYKEKFSFNEINMSKRIELNNKIIDEILKRNFDISQYYPPDADYE